MMTHQQINCIFAVKTGSIQLRNRCLLKATAQYSATAGGAYTQL